jgi:3D (Asp-Asp-Asp) domain-containing protein
MLGMVFKAEGATKRYDATKPIKKVYVSRGIDGVRWRKPLWSTQMKVTAYTAGRESTGKSPGDSGYGITASGRRVKVGHCAAPRNVPFGTVLYIEGYGFSIVEDRGHAIKGNRLDVFIPSLAEAREWGSRLIIVHVLRWGRK